MLHSSASKGGWQYLKCSHLLFLVDGEKVYPGESEHSGKVSASGYVSERITVRPSMETLRQMAGASSVQGRACLDEFTLTPEQIQTLRAFVKRIDGH